MKENPFSGVDRDHPLRNQEEIQRILTSGTDEELEVLREFHKLTPEQIKKSRDKARFKEQIEKQILDAIRRRELFGPPPTKEEIERGEFLKVTELTRTSPDDDKPSPWPVENFRKNSEAPHAYLSSQEEVDKLLKEGADQADEIVSALTQEKLQAAKTVKSLGLGDETANALALIIIGLKPATSFHLNKSEASDKTLETIRACGVRVYAQPDRDRENMREVLAAQDDDTLEKLKVTSPAKDHEEFGKLMGFPLSAIRGYLSRRMLRTGADDIDPNIVMPMRLSKAGWPEELQHLARWSYAIKAIESRV